jgi:glycosyltransferase involved in cell wall biosynthesis
VNKERLRVILLEPFLGGSHRASAEAWARHSRHRILVESLPPRFWKWRMRGAAFDYARRLAPRLAEVDVLFATDLLDLAHLQALLPRRVPSALYFHENQVSYPGRAGVELPERDLQYAFTNLASALAADRVAFNSAFQGTAFREGLEALLRRMPDARPLWVLGEIERKSAVVPLGVETSDLPSPEPRDPRDSPLVLWNHRWEYDKDPETFFGVLTRLAARRVPFRVAVAGESFGRVPPVFGRTREALGDRVAHWGCVPTRAEYVALLARADFAVSTALQENFGISLLEAACAGAHPLAPCRLSYPEVLPAALHGDCLYDGVEELEARLEALLTGLAPRLAPETLRLALAHHRWEERTKAFDELVDQVFEANGGQSVV